MSDLNLTEKITEAINNVLKKTKIFEKTDKLSFYIKTFVVVSSIIGITNIFINYTNNNNVNNLVKVMSNNKNDLIDIIENNNSQRINLLENKIAGLEDRLCVVLENQKLILSEIKKISVINVCKKECISASTSISSFMVDQLPLYQNNTCKQEKEDRAEKDKEEGNEEENELENECYDNIPLSNVKKHTIINWFL